MLRPVLVLLALAAPAVATALPLSEAVCQGPDEVRAALASEPAAAPAGLDTALHAFFRCETRTPDRDHLETLELLLDAGATPNTVDGAGRTPLHAALEDLAAPRPTPDIQLEGARTLLARGADPEAADRQGIQPIHLAAREPGAQIVPLLLGMEVSPLATDAAGHDALWHAVTGSDNRAAFERLLDAALAETATPPKGKADSPGPAFQPQPLAELAAQQGRHDLVALMLRKVPQMTLPPDRVTRALAAALWEGVSREDVEALVLAGAEPARLQELAERDLAWRLASRGEEEQLAWLLAQGWDLNRLSPQGFPPLYFADTDAARLLLDAGADPSLQANHIGTVLLPVAPPQYFPTIGDLQDEARARLLLDAGFPPDVRDRDGHTSLQLAVANDNLRLVKLLLERGADPTLHAPGSAPPLVQALYRGRLPLVQALLRAQPGVTRRNPEILLDYLETDRPDALLAEALLVAGAPLGRNAREEPALLVAARRQHWHLVPLLLKYGADPWATNARGCTLRCYEWAMPEDLREALPGNRPRPWQVPTVERYPAAFFALALSPALCLWLATIGLRLARRRSLLGPTLWMGFAAVAGIGTGGALFFHCDPCLLVQAESQLALTASVAVVAYVVGALAGVVRRLGG